VVVVKVARFASRSNLSFLAREQPLSAIPEISNRESTSSVMPEIFYQASTFLSTSGPRLKDCRGDGEKLKLQKERLPRRWDVFSQHY